MNGRPIVRCVIVVAVGVALAACAPSVQQYSEGTRSTLYSTFEDLAADSELAVLGTVQSQHTAADSDPGFGENTYTTLRVTEVFTPEHLAENRRSVSDAEPGDTIVVVQYGTADDGGTIAPILAPNTEYVLMLVAASDLIPPTGAGSGPVYWITGQTAGLLTPSADRTSFERVVLDSGDTFPREEDIATLWADRDQAPLSLPADRG